MPNDEKLDRVDYIFITVYIALILAALAYFVYAYGAALEAIVQYCQAYICR